MRLLKSIVIGWFSGRSLDPFGGWLMLAIGGATLQVCSVLKVQVKLLSISAPEAALQTPPGPPTDCAGIRYR